MTAVPGAPSTVVNAVRTMIALAALALIGIVVLFTNEDALRTAIRDNDASLDTQGIDDAVHLGLTVGAVLGVIVLVLYVVLARQVRQGRNWARVVTWVFAGIGALGALSTLAQPQTALTKLLSGIELVLYLALIVLLAMRPSSEYFRRPAH